MTMSAAASHIAANVSIWHTILKKKIRTAIVKNPIVMDFGFLTMMILMGLILMSDYKIKIDGIDGAEEIAYMILDLMNQKYQSDIVEFATYGDYEPVYCINVTVRGALIGGVIDLNDLLRYCNTSRGRSKRDIVVKYGCTFDQATDFLDRATAEGYLVRFLEVGRECSYYTYRTVNFPKQSDILDWGD